MDWFRSYHGAPFDPKWRVIAKQAKCHPGEVAAVFWALLDFASQAMKRGVTHCNKVERNNRIDEISASFDFPVDVVGAIFDAFDARNIVVDGHIVQWEKRQPKREDSSTERVRAFRERTVTQRNAPETRGNARVDRVDRTDKKIDSSSSFETDFWPLYPRRVGKGAARKAYGKALAKTTPEALKTAVQRFASECSGKDQEFIPHPARWLNAERWGDEPSLPRNQSGRPREPAHKPVSVVDATNPNALAELYK